jgi:predicted dehydrogenase
MPGMSLHEHAVGIIGLGYGRAHIPAFQAHGCRVIAVCQRDAPTAKAVASRYGVPRAFTSWERMLDEARPEIVVIATPPHLHHAIALRAFAAGAHVLCEKPLAMTGAEARSMTDAAARAGRIGMTSFNWRFTAAMQALHAAMAENAVGRVFNLAARWLGSRLADEKAAGTWRQDQAQAGHGAMGDQGVHVIDLIRWSFGEFARVVVSSGVAYRERSAPGVRRPADTDDYASVLAELTSGAHVAFTVSRVAHATNDQSLEVWGTDGALRYRLVREGPRWFEGELHASRGGAPFRPVAPRSTPPSAAGEGDATEVIGKTLIAPVVERLLHGIRTGEPPSPSFDDGLRAQRVLDAVLESSRRGAWVSLDA